MERCDQDLAFMLQYENVAWYENGKVRILDRRIYPTEVKFVECTTYKEVAQAITDMVTQSAGPYTAAGMGMALAAHEVEGKTEEEQIKLSLIHIQMCIRDSAEEADGEEADSSDAEQAEEAADANAEDIAQSERLDQRKTAQMRND